MKSYLFSSSATLKPSKLVFLFHGLGSNGQDLISLAPQFAKELPRDTVFISPDAPDACDMAPPGYEGSYQWFSLQDRDPKIIAEGVEHAHPSLKAYIEQTVAHFNLKLSDTALIGFSQGTMMSLYSGLRLSGPVAGILGYSGAMAVPAVGNVHKTDICLIHGSADDVVPSAASEEAYNHFKDLGYKAELHMRPGLSHGIDPEGQKIGTEFLKTVLGAS